MERLSTIPLSLCHKSVSRTCRTGQTLITHEKNNNNKKQTQSQAFNFFFFFSSKYILLYFLILLSEQLCWVFSLVSTGILFWICQTVRGKISSDTFLGYVFLRDSHLVFLIYFCCMCSAAELENRDTRHNLSFCQLFHKSLSTNTNKEAK